MTTYDNILAEYDRFQDLLDKDEKRDKKTEIESLITGLNSNDIDDEIYYVWGQIYYWQDYDKTENTKIALSKFKKSTGFNDDHYMSHLYTAHCYHDLKNYKNALDSYLKVDQERLRDDYPIWRYVKLIEQIGFCKYKLGQVDNALCHFQEVLDWYNKLNFDETAYPTELLDCLPEEHEIAIMIKKSKGF